MDVLKLIGRTAPLFESDVSRHRNELESLVSNSCFLVIGGAGFIGQAVTREIFKRNPLALHIIDISENNMVELVRDIRSTLGYINGDFRTFALDCGSNEFRALMSATEGYDYVLNLSALKHVRSEKDPFTLMRLIEVNILNTIETLKMAKVYGAKKYFCVSTDKAANPVNMMHANTKPDRLYDDVIMPYKAKLESWYVRNNSVWNYLLLIALTILVIFTRSTRLIFECFTSLPRPPEDLNSFISSDYYE